MSDREYLIRNLGQYHSRRALYRSIFYARHGDEIESILAIPEIHAAGPVRPLLTSFLRVVQWNIEKGKKLEGILERFENDPVLRWADVILLNEADVGMIRSGNRHVACFLADSLKTHLVFGPAYLELTKGTHGERKVEGDNRESVQGNAVLSRHPVVEARIVQLPDCFEPYCFHEKRYGHRNCVWARLEVREKTIWIGSTHLEVRSTPRCRARQMKHLVENLPGSPDEAHLLGGDFNSNGFRRGTRLRVFTSVWRILVQPPSSMKERLLRPERGIEPLFRVVRRAGFAWEGLNSSEDTASASLVELEEAEFLTRRIVDIVRRRLEPYGSHLLLKLDWLFGRGVRPLKQAELRDDPAGVSSLSPGCLKADRAGPSRISDHSPIYADVCP
jgi:endonuclease/exonuclease/phosphatase family metal-dependent hydrolase